MKFTGTKNYVATDDLKVAVNASIVLERPLLIKGEPGTGKTVLAEEVAKALDAPLLTWHTKSTTKAQQGLYEYDAVSRLRDSQLGDPRVSDISNYIKRGKLWEAFTSEKRPVLLIDEIDKADIEFPNDLLRESDRTRLVPLIGRLFGTAEDSPELRARLRITQTRQVVVLLEPAARPRVLGAVERAESWIGLDGDEEVVRQAFAEAMGFPLVSGDLDASHTEFHQNASRMFPFSFSLELEAAEAYALTALVIAHRVAAAGECRADCGNGPARARRMVKDLSGLIDVYDEVTGRTVREVTVDEVRELESALRV